MRLLTLTTHRERYMTTRLPLLLVGEREKAKTRETQKKEKSALHLRRRKRESGWPCRAHFMRVQKKKKLQRRHLKNRRRQHTRTHTESLLRACEQQHRQQQYSQQEHKEETQKCRSTRGRQGKVVVVLVVLVVVARRSWVRVSRIINIVCVCLCVSRGGYTACFSLFRSAHTLTQHRTKHTH